MLTGSHHVARTPPAFFSLELSRPLNRYRRGALDRAPRAPSRSSCRRCRRQSRSHRIARPQSRIDSIKVVWLRDARSMAYEFKRGGRNRRLAVEVFSKTFHVKRFSFQENETRTFAVRAFRAIFGRVEYSQDFDGVAAHAVGHDVRGAGDYQFAGAGDPSDAAGGWIGGELLDGGCDSLHSSRGGIRVVACDVFGFLIEISERAPKPSYAHGGSTSSSRLGLLSQLRSRLRRPP